jgi:polyisoprenyl-phosphate glycosyltransferase
MSLRKADMAISTSGLKRSLPNIANMPSVNVARDLISIVVPVYNEADGIAEFHSRLSVVRIKLAERSEVIYVNDGSCDKTFVILRSLRERDPSVSIVNLSRNFGKEIALTAGLDHSDGDAIILIDADLQDPPELIPILIKRWRETNADVVFARRTSRTGESWLKKATAHSFYRIINALSVQTVPVDTGDFRLLSRRAADAVKICREQHRFMKGLFAWIGYRQVAVPYERDKRFAGDTKWNYWRLWNLSLEGITSFTTAPLRVATYTGLFTAVLAVLYGIYITGRTILFGNPVAGYPSLLVIMLFLGGVQLLSLGIIGEYLGRVFNETKKRPLYFIDTILPGRPAQTTGHLLSADDSPDTNATVVDDSATDNTKSGVDSCA